MGVENLAETVLKELKNIMDSKSVVGEPVKLEDKILVPVTKFSFGFGIGATSTNSKNAESGGGTGGGASIEPVGFLVIDEEGTRFVRASDKPTLIERLLNSPHGEFVLNKLKKVINEKLDKKPEKRSNEQAQQPSVQTNLPATE